MNRLPDWPFVGSFFINRISVGIAVTCDAIRVLVRETIGDKQKKESRKEDLMATDRA